MLEDVAAAIDAGSLAVPHREHAIDLGAGIEIELLRAPDRRRGQVFVQTGLKFNVVALEKFRGFPQREIEGAKRRTAIPGHEAGRVQTGELVALTLQGQQTDERLNAGDEDATR